MIWRNILNQKIESEPVFFLMSKNSSKDRLCKILKKKYEGLVLNLYEEYLVLVNINYIWTQYCDLNSRVIPGNKGFNLDINTLKLINDHDKDVNEEAIYALISNDEKTLENLDQFLLLTIALKIKREYVRVKLSSIIGAFEGRISDHSKRILSIEYELCDIDKYIKDILQKIRGEKQSTQKENPEEMRRRIRVLR